MEPRAEASREVEAVQLLLTRELVRRRTALALDRHRAWTYVARWATVHAAPPLTVAAVASILLPIGFWTALLVATAAIELRRWAPTVDRRLR